MARRYWGDQPALLVARRERWTIPMLAREIDEEVGHLTNVLHGRTRPKPNVRTRLPEVLGVSLDDLFDEDILAKPYDPARRAGVDAGSCLRCPTR